MNKRIAAGLLGLGVALTPVAAVALSPGVQTDLTAEYKFKWAQRDGGKDQTDQDLRLGFGLDAARVFHDALSFSALLSVEQDLDGTSASSIYKDLLDSYSDRNVWLLYRAALTYRVADSGLDLVLGRQEVWSAEITTLDGGLLRWKLGRLGAVDLFAGKRVSFYASPDPKGVFGGDLELRPWRGGALTLRDLYYIDNSLRASVVQRLWGRGTGDLTYRMINGDPRDLTVGLHVYPWREAEGHLRVLRLYEDYLYDYTSAAEYEVPNLDLGEQAPYTDYRFTARQGVFGVAGLGGRLRAHRLVNRSDEDAFNVDFDEVAVVADLSEWPWRGLRLDGEVIRWVEDRQRDDLASDNLWGGTIRLQQSLREHSVGGSYHRRSFDGEGEVRDAAGFDLWARLRVVGRADLSLRYEREENDLYKQAGFDVLNVLTARLDLAF